MPQQLPLVYFQFSVSFRLLSSSNYTAPIQKGSVLQNWAQQMGWNQSFSIDNSINSRIHTSSTRAQPQWNLTPAFPLMHEYSWDACRSVALARTYQTAATACRNTQWRDLIRLWCHQPSLKGTEFIFSSHI